MNLLALLDELRGMARTGLNFTDDPYDRERYERILELVDQYYGRSLDLPPAKIRDRLADELGQVTPKVGVEAVVFDERDRVLLMERRASGRWCLPGGAVEMHESPEEAAIREAEEETGLLVEPLSLIGAYRRAPDEYYPYATVLLPYLAEVRSGELRLSHEGEDLQYWEIEAVPSWFPKHERIALDARGAWRRDDQSKAGRK